MKFKIILQTLSVLLFVLGVTLNSNCQEDKSKRPSPPANVSKTIGDLTLTVDYSSPGVKGRKLWGGLVPFDEVWRTGANEATTFEVNKDVVIEGQKLPSGKYGLFTIPGESEWVFIFNKEPDQWGAYDYESKLDALRVTVKPTKATTFTERLAFEIAEKDSNAAEVRMNWGNLSVGFTAQSAK